MRVSLSELAEVKGIGKKTLNRVRKHKLGKEDYISEYDKDLHLHKNTLYKGDCLELMNGIPDKSIDMILADLPYGTTQCSWDSIIDLDILWMQYRRVIKDNGAIVLTASEPFTSKLIMSNLQMFKYCWIWDKRNPSNFFAAKFQPLNNTEDIIVFSKGGCNNGTNNPMKYNPQGVKTINKVRKNSKSVGGQVGDAHSTSMERGGYYKQEKTGYPKKTLSFPLKNKGLHPTQKPVKLFEYLIKTYTDEGDLVLDNVAGSGTTAVACIRTNRNYICIEKDEEYYKKSINRIDKLEES